MTWNPFKWLFGSIWRKHNELGEKFNRWDINTEKQLKTDIKALVGEERLNIMLVGAVGSGKSSTINSICSIMNGRISCRTNAGSYGESFTTKYSEIKGEGEFENIFFYDTSGIEDQSGPSTRDVEDAVNGGRKPGDKFVAQESSTEVEKNEDLEIHCIIYVLDAENVKHGLRMSTKRKLEDVVRTVREGPSRVVFLTHVDIISSKVNKDNKNIFSCYKIQNIVALTSALMTIDEGLIYPIRNYVTEQDVCPAINIPLLLALKKVVGFASDCRKGK